MKIVNDIAIGGLVIATLLLPLIALRWAPQLLGRCFGPKVKFATLALGTGLLVFAVASFAGEHRMICSEGEQEFRCEISWMMIAPLFGGWALLALTQAGFVWSTISSIWPKNVSEA